MKTKMSIPQSIWKKVKDNPIVVMLALASIIMISSEMAELIGMSDRVMVMCDGRVTGFIDGKDATQENIMELATQFEAD